MRIYPNPEKLAESKFQTLINRRHRTLMFLLEKIFQSSTPLQSMGETGDKDE